MWILNPDQLHLVRMKMYLLRTAGKGKVHRRHGRDDHERYIVSLGQNSSLVGPDL